MGDFLGELLPIIIIVGGIILSQSKKKEKKSSDAKNETGAKKTVTKKDPLEAMRSVGVHQEKFNGRTYIHVEKQPKEFTKLDGTPHQVILNGKVVDSTKWH